MNPPLTFSLPRTDAACALATLVANHLGVMPDWVSVDCACGLKTHYPILGLPQGNCRCFRCNAPLIVYEDAP